MQYMVKNDATIQSQTSLIQSQASLIRNLKTQMGQLASALRNRQQGALPSDTENNSRRDGKEHCMAINLKSGKELPEVSSSQAQKQSVYKDDEVVVTEDPSHQKEVV